MEKSVLLFEDVNLNKEAWIEARKLGITGTDASKCLQYYVNGETNYYGNSIFKLMHDKFNKKEINDYEREIFREGHLYEELVYKSRIKKYPNRTFKKNRCFSKGCFIATLDIEETDESGVTKIIECKTGRSRAKFEMAKIGTHPMFWQACHQLYVCDHVDSVLINYKLLSDDNEKVYLKYILRDSDHYIKFLSYIEQLQTVHKLIQEGKEPFLASIKDDAIYIEMSNNMISIREEIDSIDAQIEKLQNLKKPLNEKLDELRDSALDYFNEAIHLQRRKFENGNEYKFVIKKEKTYNYDFEKEIERIKKTVKNFKETEYSVAEEKYKEVHGILPFYFKNDLRIYKN